MYDDKNYEVESVFGLKEFILSLIVFLIGGIVMISILFPEVLFTILE
jgi:hypothetical protein